LLFSRVAISRTRRRRRTFRRSREVAQRIKEAREFGDITENSEYDDAKNEQAMLEARIAQVEDRLRSATVIAAEDVTTDKVQVGSIVSVKNADTGKAQKFTIVGSPEAKPPERLSYESPVGKALLGRAVDALGNPVDGKGPIAAKAALHDRGTIATDVVRLPLVAATHDQLARVREGIQQSGLS